MYPVKLSLLNVACKFHVLHLSNMYRIQKFGISTLKSFQLLRTICPWTDWGQPQTPKMSTPKTSLFPQTRRVCIKPWRTVARHTATFNNCYTRGRAWYVLLHWVYTCLLQM